MITGVASSSSRTGSGAGIMPYYFDMCDMIAGAEHWRLTPGEAQALQSAVMGYLPGFGTLRVVCDVP